MTHVFTVLVTTKFVPLNCFNSWFRGGSFGISGSSSVRGSNFFFFFVFLGRLFFFLLYLDWSRLFSLIVLLIFRFRAVGRRIVITLFFLGLILPESTLEELSFDEV
jgi:hypothetical protein